MTPLPLDRPLGVTMFRCQDAAIGASGFASWTQLVAWFDLPAAIVATKNARPAWAPYVLAQGAPRRAANIGGVDLFSLDFDDNSHGEFLAALARVRELGCAYYAHTTWSHTGPFPAAPAAATDRIRARLVIPLARMCAPAQFANRFARVTAITGAKTDPRAERLAQLSFVVVRKPSAPEPWRDARMGPFLDVEGIPDFREVSADALVILAGDLRRRKTARDVSAAMLRSLVALEPYATEGARNSLAWRMTGYIARAFPTLDPFAVAALFSAHPGQSVGADAPDLADMLSRHLSSASVERTQVLDRMRAFWERHGEPSRTEPYNMAELDEIRAAEPSGPWILQGPDGHHFLTLSGYTEAYQRNAPVAAMTVLAPAPVRAVSESGQPRELAELTAEYGVDVERVDWCLYPPDRQYDPTTRTLTLCRTPLRRDLAPERVGHVDEWLAAMLGDEGHTLARAWLSHLPDLRQPLACLYLWGPKGAGKDTFARCCASGWSRRAAPTTLTQALGSWTGCLCACPVCYANERFPHDRNGRPLTAEFRELIGAGQHKWEEKNARASVIIGHPRVIAGANNDTLFRVHEDMSVDDFEAIDERVASLRVSADGARMLAGWPQGRVRDLWEDGVFFRHVLWLAQSPANRIGKRFGVENTDAHYRAQTRVSVGWARYVGEGVLRWVAGGCVGAAAGQALRAVIGADGRPTVSVSPLALHSAWMTIVGSRRCPELVSAVARACETMAAPGPHPVGWVTLTADALDATARASGIVPPEALPAALGAAAGRAAAASGGAVVLPFGPTAKGPSR